MNKGIGTGMQVVSKNTLKEGTVLSIEYDDVKVCWDDGTVSTVDRCNLTPTYKQNDNVNHPTHYADYYPMEVHDIIECIFIEMERRGIDLAPIQWSDLFNEFKYRLRAGWKGNASEDIAKAMWYNNSRKEHGE